MKSLAMSGVKDCPVKLGRAINTPGTDVYWVGSYPTGQPIFTEKMIARDL
jgi:hypothetical protein